MIYQVQQPSKESTQEEKETEIRLQHGSKVHLCDRTGNELSTAHSQVYPENKLYSRAENRYIHNIAWGRTKIPGLSLNRALTPRGRVWIWVAGESGQGHWVLLMPSHLITFSTLLGLLLPLLCAGVPALSGTWWCYCNANNKAVNLSCKLNSCQVLLDGCPHNLPGGV